MCSSYEISKNQCAWCSTTTSKKPFHISNFFAWEKSKAWSVTKFCTWRESCWKKSSKLGIVIYKIQGGVQEGNHIKKSQKTTIMFPHIQLVVFGFQMMLYICWTKIPMMLFIISNALLTKKERMSDLKPWGSSSSKPPQFTLNIWWY